MKVFGNALQDKNSLISCRKVQYLGPEWCPINSWGRQNLHLTFSCPRDSTQKILHHVSLNCKARCDQVWCLAPHLAPKHKAPDMYTYIKDAKFPEHSWKKYLALKGLIIWHLLQPTMPSLQHFMLHHTKSWPQNYLGSRRWVFNYWWSCMPSQWWWYWLSTNQTWIPRWLSHRINWYISFIIFIF
jgi:hypothetical protein